MSGKFIRFVVLVAFASIAQAVVADETGIWQTKIDSVAAAGGGCVSVPAGRHLVGQLDLKSNVELRLEKGAVLEGLVGLEHYRVTTLPYSEGTWSAIVSAIGVTNVAITGEGEIFGNGKSWKIPEDYGGNQEGLRTRGVFFADSECVRLSDFTLRDAACWGIVFKCCRHVRVDGVRIDNHANSNNDGFDIEASDVLVENCDVDAGDDAYCIKSNNPHFTVENVTVRNCIARSHSNGCKIGTATHGTIRNVLFENIVCRAPRRDFIDNRKTSPNFGKPHFYRPELLHLPVGGGLGAVTVECVDGGRVENVFAKDIEVSGFIAPIFVRAGTRTGRDCGTPPGNQYVFRNIRIENVHGRSETPIASSDPGVDGCRVKDVVRKDIDIVSPGADEVASRLALETPVPDVSGLYPECTMFRPSILPAYGLYVDRIDGILLENVRFRLKDGSGDVRPPIFFSENVLGVRQIQPSVRGSRVQDNVRRTSNDPASQQQGSKYECNAKHDCTLPIRY
ncbi:MAG: right-handed parallel beta-helix repeat-containing protein [bacterium]|nr:right-handed parallel beta-helix repeat-containing protein [Candidatus Colisoma equi]